MVPNRQWCYTPEKGKVTGTKDRKRYLPRSTSSSGSTAPSSMTTATMPISRWSFPRAPSTGIPPRLSPPAGNWPPPTSPIALALSGDEVVDHPLKADDLRLSPRLVVIEPQDLSEAARAVLNSKTDVQRYSSIKQAIAGIAPAVRVKAPDKVRVLPRVKPARRLSIS